MIFFVQKSDVKCTLFLTQTYRMAYWNIAHKLYGLLEWCRLVLFDYP